MNLREADIVERVTGCAFIFLLLFIMLGFFQDQPEKPGYSGVVKTELEYNLPEDKLALSGSGLIPVDLNSELGIRTNPGPVHIVSHVNCVICKNLEINGIFKNCSSSYLDYKLQLIQYNFPRSLPIRDFFKRQV